MNNKMFIVRLICKLEYNGDLVINLRGGTEVPDSYTNDKKITSLSKKNPNVSCVIH